jgi:hypothetical protein
MGTRATMIERCSAGFHAFGDFGGANDASGDLIAPTNKEDNTNVLFLPLEVIYNQANVDVSIIRCS